MVKQHTVLLVLLIAIMLSFTGIGLITDGVETSLSGFVDIQIHPGRLINDFVVAGGIGGTLINAAVAGAVGLIIILLLKVQLSGPTYAAILTIIGFGFFGKTPLNILPVMIGVFIAAKFAGKTCREYLIIALFGTALGPLVAFVVFESGLQPAAAYPVAIVCGILTGVLLPAIAFSMLHMHQGYNLYNIGLTCGFFALFAASLVRAIGHKIESKLLTGTLLWYGEPSPVLILLVPVLSVVLIIAGLVLGGRKCIKGLLEIQKIPGRLPSDFMDIVSMESTLINSGLLGFGCSAYVYFIGGDFNGPILGGLLTVMGFGAFGTQLKNASPVIAGVVISSLVFGYDLSSPGPLLAALFCTTLAPLAGQFGIVVGVIAGFIHLFMVMHTGSWQGGLNLYNNGFAGGLTATFIVAVIQWYRTNKTGSS